MIAQFGRFPHRNTVLGRVSSAEELGFLQSLVLHEWEVIDSAGLRQQQGGDGKAAVRTTAKRTNMT